MEKTTLSFTNFLCKKIGREKQSLIIFLIFHVHASVSAQSGEEGAMWIRQQLSTFSIFCEI